MSRKMDPIRNDAGSLLCEACFTNGVWALRIKRKEHWTSVFLRPDGHMVVQNEKPPDEAAP